MKSVATLFASASLLALAACGGAKNETAPAEAPATEPMTTEAPPMEPVDPMPTDPMPTDPVAGDPVTDATPPAGDADDSPDNAGNDRGRPSGG